ncbi:MAG: hypothetical protein K0S70_3298, partial [Microbacterium sp.]|nr:hypothetical protein [Microbacterium sp.]
VGVHEQRPVALVHEQTSGEGKMRVEAAGVVDGATGDDETHLTSLIALATRHVADSPLRIGGELFDQGEMQGPADVCG